MKPKRQIYSCQVFLSTEADCCISESSGEVCWEPCYCVLLQDEQTLTAYRNEDMAVSFLF